jgi:hypothetical protein
VDWRLARLPARRSLSASIVNSKGADSKRFAYFRVTETIERRNPSGGGGYSFERHKADLKDVVLPFSAERPSLRRRRVA